MSIFKFNYNKEGPGIEKDAPEKNIILTFLGVFKRNFWNFIRVNFLYTAASIPMIILLAWFFTVFLYPYLTSVIADLTKAAEGIEASQVEATYLGVFNGIFIIEMLLFIGSGPASVYFAYASKCFTTEEHLWIWSDFLGKIKENFKQSIIVWVVDIVGIFLFFNAVSFYNTLYKSTGNILFFVLSTVLLVFSAIYIFMHGYIWQMIITFENKLLILYKNAFILAIAKLPQNLCLMLVPAILSYLLFSIITPTLAVILLFIIWYFVIRFPMEFYAARTLKEIIANNEEYADRKGIE